MLFLDFMQSDPAEPVLVNGPVMLRPAVSSDYRAWKNLREKSRERLTLWEPDWTAQEASREAFQRRLRAYAHDMRRGAALPLFIVRSSDQTLVGAATLTHIRRGASQIATLGYWIGAGHLRNGYGLAAVEAIVDHAFNALALNRIEAACQPDNHPSRALLSKAGFHKEGMARAYLLINGAWRDHEIYATIAARQDAS